MHDLAEMTPEQRTAVADFARGILQYFEDGCAIELRDCGVVAELIAASAPTELEICDPSEY